MRNQRGITLIALVITIIVLLILAGVSIAMLSGENGILTRSNQAAKETAFATARENVANAINEAMTDYYGNVYVDDGDAVMSTRISAALDALDGDDDGGATIEYDSTTDLDTITIKYNGEQQVGTLATENDEGTKLIGGVSWDGITAIPGGE